MRTRRGVNFWYRSALALGAVAAVVIALVIAGRPGSASAQVPGPIFTIGTIDQSAAEFALAPGGYDKYSSTFPDDATFTVGTSDPAKDWPYVQPGPQDSWAGSKAHTFTIDYSLDAAPAGDLELLLNYADTHNYGPPQVVVGSNGTTVRTLDLPAGGGSGVYGEQPAKPYQAAVLVPASTLHAGQNSITITNATRSWTVWDAVTLQPAPTGPPQVAITSVTQTPLFTGHGNSEHQMLNLHLRNSGAQDRVSFTATAGGLTARTTVTALLAESDVQIAVPPAPKGDPVALSITTGAGKAYHGMLSYERRWQLDIIHGSHQDIGYTDIQPNVRKTQDEYLDTAIEECRATAGNPAASKFRWTIEHAWMVDNYIKDRPVEQVKALGDCLRSDQLELQGTYDNNLYDLDSPEQMARAMYKGTNEFPKKFGVAVDTAIQDDVTGVSEQDIQAMARSGIKLMLNGANSDHAPQTQKTSALFWWQAPDQSRVLSFYTPAAYPEGYNYYHLDAPPDQLNQVVAGVTTSPLNQLQQAGYPQSVYPLMLFNDNHGPVSTLPNLVQEFGQKYSWPKLVVSTPQRFYHDALQEGVQRLPTVHGDYTGWWSDGAGSSAFETGENQQAQARTTSAETLGTLAGPDPQRTGAIADSYENQELYTEHTWGGAALDWNDPEWPYKKAFADDAAKQSTQAMQSAVHDLSAQVTNDSANPGIVVFNSLSWKRSDQVEATVPGTGSFALRSNGHDVQYEVVARSDHDTTIRFTAEDVPAIGYRTYETAPGPDSSTSADPSLAASTSGLENSYYRVRLDPRSGAIASVVDKRNGRELVDSASDFQLNQYVYRPNCAGADRNNVCQTSAENQWSPSDPTVRVVSDGPIAATIEITYSGGPGGATTGVDGITEQLSLPANTPRLELSDTIDKVRVDTAEEGYFAFPFKQQDPTVTYEVPGAAARLFTDQAPGAAMDWQSMRSYADVSGRSSGVTLSSTDAPLVEFGRIRTQEFQGRPGSLDGSSVPVDPGKYQPHNGSVFSYIFNNLWHTNYRIAQAGPIAFHYAITDHAGDFDPVAATHFGWGQSTPLQAAALTAGQTGRLPAGAGSLVSVDSDHVVVQAIKAPADGGDGMVVRLLEIGGRPAEVNLRMPFAVGSAQLQDLVERPIGPLPAGKDTVRVPVRAHGMITVRLHGA
ncbi:MAG TPA: polysaccharide lyase family protein [Mycobacteriales bacterium]|nr:polysaccharide lyase family protein [Mycobacteriales bacterium]